MLEDNMEHTEITGDPNMFKLPSSIASILEGNDFPADPNNKTDFNPPKWFDNEKYKLGQKFAMANFMSLNIIEVLSLIMVFSFKEGLEPLIYTNKSSSPFTVFQRYLSTLLKIRSWYTDNIFDRKSLAGTNITTVRAMHRHVRDRMKTGDPKEVSKRISIENPCCPLLNYIHGDVQNSIPEPKPGQCPYNHSTDNNFKHVNQFQMAGTQFTFVGFTILYSSKFGISATKQELDGFVHLWACVGYLLGIEDKYNFCLGGLDNCIQRSKDFIELCIKPNLRVVLPEWEHMCRSLVEGTKYSGPMPILANFEAMLLYLFWVLNIPLHKSNVGIPFLSHVRFYIYRIMLCFIMFIPGFRIYMNWMLNFCVQRSINYSPEYLKELKQFSDDYMRKHSKQHQN